METLTTPINLIESYFDLKRKPASLKKLNEVTEDRWIDFAKFYRGRMTLDFPAQFLQPTESSDAALRLYFEPRTTSRRRSRTAATHRRSKNISKNSECELMSGQLTTSMKTRLLRPG